jgi:CO/xanthine dehydrogenase Mo-binding subunit
MSWSCKEKSGPYRKKSIGFGAMWYGIGNTGVKNPSTARVEMDPERNITLFTGCAELGQGSTTVLTQIACEIIGIQPQDLNVVVGDTHLTANAGATSASRQTYISGNAVKSAAEQLADVLKAEAVNRLRAQQSELVLESGCVQKMNAPDQKVTFGDLAKSIRSKGVSLSYQGYFDPETVPFDPKTGQGVPYASYAFACQMAMIIADRLTGEVTVEKIVAAHDVGKAIHPENVIGQICGGIAMGVGEPALIPTARPFSMPWQKHSESGFIHCRPIWNGFLQRASPQEILFRNRIFLKHSIVGVYI